MTEETKQSIEYVIGKLGDAVEALGGPASHVYEILIRQSIVEGVQSLVIALLFSAAIPLFVKAARSAWVRVVECEDYGELLFGASLLGCLICAIVGVCNLHGAIPRLFNPEFYAIKFLMDRML